MKRLSIVVKMLVVSAVSIVLASLPFLLGFPPLVARINQLIDFSHKSSIGWQANFFLSCLALGILSPVQIFCVFVLFWWLTFLWTDKFSFDWKINRIFERMKRGARNKST